MKFSGVLPFCLLPIYFLAQNPPDTVYTNAVTSLVETEGEPVAGATISYTLLDTVNGTQELIREALTNEFGEDIVDSLPVLKHYS